MQANAPQATAPQATVPQAPVPQPVPMGSPPAGAADAVQELPLRGLHLPAEPGFWPLAPGWWVLAIVVFLLLVFIAIKWYQRNKRKQQLLAIENQLGAINFSYQEHKDKRLLLSELSMLLRRFEKFQQNKNQAAALSGAAWIAHLNSYHKDQPFTEFESLLIDGIYLPTVEFEPQPLSDLIGMHIKKVVMTPKEKLAKKFEKSTEGATHV